MERRAMLLRAATATVATLLLSSCSEETRLPSAVAPPNGPATQSVVLPGSGTWTTGADLPTPRAFAAAAVLGGKMYVAGGRNVQNTTLDVVERYDPQTNSWDTPTSLPVATLGGAMAALNGQLWFLGNTGGSAGATPFWTYIPGTNRWKGRAPAPRNHFFSALVPLDGKLYAIGAEEAGYPTDAVDRYDPATNSWTAVASLPEPLETQGAVVFDGKIWLAGGYTTGSAGVFVYDPGLNSWSTESPTNPIPNAYCAFLGVVKGTLYSYYGDADQMRGYDATHGAWVALPSSLTGRYCSASVVIGGSIYTVGGSSGQAGLDIFTPAFAGNHAPTVVMGGPYAGVEGSAIQFDASATTDADGDGVGYSWDFGDGSGSNDAAPQHTYASYGRRTVTLDVGDDHDKHTVVTQAVYVANVPPALTLPQHDTIFVNNSYYAQLSFTDPGANTWSATVDYGAGGGTNSLLLSGKGFVLTYPYPHGAYRITVKVNDGRATTTATSTVRVLGQVGALDYVLAKIAALGATQSVKDSLAASLRKARYKFLHGNTADAHTFVTAFDSAVTTQLNLTGIDQETADQLHAYAAALANAI